MRLLLIRRKARRRRLGRRGCKKEMCERGSHQLEFWIVRLRAEMDR